MPALVPQRRRRRSEEAEDEESDAAGDVNPPSRDAGAMTTNGDANMSDGTLDSDSDMSMTNKRARGNNDQDVSDASPGPVLPPGYRAEQVESQEANFKHQPGSLVRVKLRNFVTYTAAEFRLGPSLNMIIGPNGTGKSTLVCAICLGLGWSPTTLGRAKEVGEFVKHGFREAETEIELQGGRQHKYKNPIIRRTIKREGNKSSWQINGHQATKQEVLELCRSYAIQIDNLCQFLPQDRVAAFANLTPIELLEQTQRAAAPAHMTEWHQELKKLRAQQKKEEGDEQSFREKLDSLQARQNAQRADVERMEQRQALLVRHKALEKCRPLVQYNMEKEKAHESKRMKDEASAHLRELKAEVQPALRAIDEKREYSDQVKRAKQSRQNLVERQTKEADNADKKITDFGKLIDDCETDISAERKSEASRRNDIARTEGNIARLTKQRENAPVEVNAAEFNEQIREKARLMREYDETMEEKQTSMHSGYQAARTKKSDIDRCEKDLADLKTQAGQQFSKLRGFSEDSAKAYTWLKQNASLFEGPVYGPPIVECSIPDARYADAVESAFQRSDFLAFTCTTKQDFQILQEKIYGRNNLWLKDVSIRSAGTALDNFRSPASAEQLQNYGLNGWLLDYITGPEAVLSTLCESIRLHQTAVTPHEHSSEQFERLKNSNIQSWVTRSQYHRVTRRREYGPDAVSTTVKPIRRARFWADNAVDSAAEEQLQDQLRTLQHELAELTESYTAFETERKELKQRKDALRHEKDELEKEKSDRQQARAEWDILPSKIETQTTKLEELKSADSAVRERIDAIKAKQCKLSLDRAQLCVDYANTVDTLRKLHTDLFEAEIVEIEAVSDLTSLQTRSDDVTRMLRQREEEVKDLEQQHRNAHNAARATLQQYKQIQAQMTDEESEVHAEMHQVLNPDTLDAEIDAVAARIELLHDGNPDAIKQFEQRQADIDKIADRLSNLTNTLANLSAAIAQVRTKWEPALDGLMTKISAAFSHNFAQIGCAGQVGIFRDTPDFDAWAAQIRVKFRESEPLSLLDAHRQSGGERAVSTIFYLLSLQSLARSPFRVVDEINQGMDPRNERMVHERMVDIACREHTSQYLLVTPKLLPGLRYHERMKVHCIASGEWMPEDPTRLDFARLAEVALRVKGKA